jgi:hypothetical protein
MLLPATLGDPPYRSRLLAIKRELIALNWRLSELQEEQAGTP